MILDSIEGLKPDPAKHNSYFSIEPITGMALDAHVRLQISMYIEPFYYNATNAWFSNVEPVYMPVIWEDEVGIWKLVLMEYRWVF